MSDQVIRQRVRQQYGAAGDAYVTSPTHRYGKDLPRLVEVAEPRSDMRVLDVATGGGHTALALAPLVAEVVMLDLTPQMLTHARDFAREQGETPLGYVAATAEDLPFPSQSFDLVTCRIAPHHFAGVGRFVAEVARVLAPGGAFVLIDSLAPDEPELDAFINTLERRRDPSHVRSYSLAEWTGFLERAGLDVEHVERILKRHDYEPWTARSRMSDEERDALGRWALAHDATVRDAFNLAEENGRLISFDDIKVLIRARKPR